MNFLLKNLELELEESHLLVGEKLLEEGKVESLVESERNLWIATVDRYEIEMQISPSKVRACSCECNVFKTEKMCSHLAAGLLALRRRLSEKNKVPENKAAHSTKTFHYQRLTTTAILDNVKTEDLAAFVRQYAKSNRAFALALKTRFAANVPMADSFEKYSQLLDATILAGRSKNDWISSSGSIQLLKTINELVGQAEDAMALAYFGEGWAILSAILEKTTPVLRKILGDNTPLQMTLLEVLDRLDALVRQPIPPDLRQEIWDFSLRSFPRPGYRLNDLSLPLLNLLRFMCDDPTRSASLLQVIDSELNKTSNAPFDIQVLLRSKILLLEHPGMETPAGNFTLECLAHPPTLLLVVEAAEAGCILKNIKPLIEKGLRLVESDSLKKRLEQALLKLAHEQGDRQAIVKLSRERFLQTRDFNYFDNCKAHFKGNWSIFIDKLLADFIRQPGYTQNMETIAQLLAREGRLDELKALLTEQASLDLFMRFDHLLVEKHSDWVLAFYEGQLKNYLSVHLGPAPARRIRHILDHLRACNAGALAEKLAASLIEAYNTRNSLTEELEFL